MSVVGDLIAMEQTIKGRQLMVMIISSTCWVAMATIKLFCTRSLKDIELNDKAIYLYSISQGAFSDVG